LKCAAFTLIELLIVIGIIVLLAGMLFTALPAIQRVKTTSRLKNEMGQIQTAIEAYKAKKGYYPPDNPVPGVICNDYSVNQLYYELIGTRLTNDPGVTPAGYYFYTTDGSARIQTNAMPVVFGAGSKVVGFDNCTRGAGDDAVRAENFFKGGLRSGQFFATSTTTVAGSSPSVLGSGIDGKFMIGKVNPWRYNSSNPTNNPGTFDLWIDYDFGGKSNRICNWSDRAIQAQ
jgi:prepilin-type N-terminal cleavage/methylation domain-containing protein